MREFPHFVQLHETFANDIACASLNVDFYGSDNDSPTDIKPRVVEFLTSRNATMQNFVSSDTDESILQQIETASIPAAIVYDREGKLHTIFNNDKEAYGPEGFNYEDDITKLVTRLVEGED
jgi:hypothetical protein